MVEMDVLVLLLGKLLVLTVSPQLLFLKGEGLNN